ncbi:hypothetical protein D3C73_1568770 [compost metagenome]
MTVKIDGFVVWIVLAWNDALGDFAWNTVRAAGQHVTNAWPFAAFVPAAFNLMRRNRATP